MKNSAYKLLLTIGIVISALTSVVVHAEQLDEPQLPVTVTHAPPLSEQKLMHIRGQGETVTPPSAPHIQLAVILWDESERSGSGGNNVQIHNTGYDNVQTQTLSLYR